MKHSERMFNADVRIAKLFWLPGEAAQIGNSFESFIEDELPEAEDVLTALPWLRDFEGEPEDYAAEFFYHGCEGFIAELLTPSPRDVKPDGSFTSSWGSCRLTWVYAANLDDLCQKAEAWAESVIAAAKAKAA